MAWSALFFINSIFLGIGLAMDAFSVSLVNGMNEPQMSMAKEVGIAGVFAFFQAVMPITGWVFTHTMVTYFVAFEHLVPWISLLLLLFIGGKMIKNSRSSTTEEAHIGEVSVGILLIQGLATSIDALSVGFTLATYGATMAVVCALLIAGVTFPICMAGIILGKRAGLKLSGKSEFLGGLVLIAIGIEIFVAGIV